MVLRTDGWPSDNFSLAELSCRRTGEYYHDPEFLWRLERLRYLNGQRPLVINSAHRSPVHNAAVGGAPLSQHKKMAVDIALDGHNPQQLRQLAIECGFLGVGMARTFLHLDLRRPIGNVTFSRDRLTQWFYGDGSRKFWLDKIDI